MRSARSISPATCRSSWVPTGRAWAASSARPSSSRDELWKIGQLTPGRQRALPAGDAGTKQPIWRGARRSAISHRVPENAFSIASTGRRPRGLPPRGRRQYPRRIWADGARLRLRLRVICLMQAMRDAKLPGIVDLTPGIRSLQVHFDSSVARRNAAPRRAAGASKPRCPTPRRRLRCRQPHRPPAAVLERSEQAQLAMRKYQELVRPERALVPVEHRVHPADQRPRFPMTMSAHRLRRQLSRAGPRRRLSRRAGRDAARSAPPSGHDQIQSGADLDAGKRGGHRRRLSLRLRHGRTGRLSALRPHHPDVEFLAPDRLLRAGHPGCCASSIRSASSRFPARNCSRRAPPFSTAQYPLKIEQSRFTLSEHEKFLAANGEQIAAFKARQQAAFEAERQRWRDQGLDSYVADDGPESSAPNDETWPEGTSPVHASAMGTVWKIEVAPGQRVSAGQALVIIESMKMEIAIPALSAGVIRELRCQPGRIVKPGQVIALIEEER